MVVIVVEVVVVELAVVCHGGSCLWWGRWFLMEWYVIAVGCSGVRSVGGTLWCKWWLFVGVVVHGGGSLWWWFVVVVVYSSRSGSLWSFC